MSTSTAFYRSVMLAFERLRAAAAWPSWRLEEAAGLHEGHYQHCLHPDTKHGRQANWTTLDLIAAALAPEGYVVLIRPQKRAMLARQQASRKIRLARARFEPVLRAEVMRELSRLGARKGGQERARKLGARERKRIARRAALARWRADARLRSSRSKISK